MPALAARCSHCGTVFRVVQDQLRVAGGLVRCGRCGEVFNASENLIDVGTAAAAGSPAGDVAGQAGHRPAAPPPEPAAAGPDGIDFELAIEPEAPPQEAAPPRRPEPEPELVPEPEPEPEPAPERQPPATTEKLRAPALEPEPAAERPAGRAPVESDLRAEPEQAPSFMRSPARESRWQQPRLRRMLALACGLGLLLLAGQAAHTWRDHLAASAPGLRGPLTAACGLLRCQIEAVRSIDSLAVDSSGLVRVERSNVYKLQVVLRNRASQAVAVPALDVTLSDASGQLIARRVLRASELGVTETTLAAGRELSLQATLQARLAGTEAIAGYTIELFYP
jgi:predicted Zn finger-like uncharacterized protein